MSNYSIPQASFQLSIKDLKDKQELAHHPMDFNLTTVKAFDVLEQKSGYTGPQYEENSMLDNIMVASSQSNVGLSLPVNKFAGAPAMTMVYGAYPYGSCVQYSELIRVKIGPDKTLFDPTQLKSLANPQLLDGIPVSSTGTGSLPFLPGLITGTGGSDSEQYIPTAIANLPYNVEKVNNYVDRIYDTYNVWDISGRTNSFSTETYLYSYGRNTSNRLLNPGHIFQLSAPGKLRVKFAAYATELELYKVSGTYNGVSAINDVNRIAPGSRWMFMGDYRQAKYLLGPSSVSAPDEEATETLKNKVGLFEIATEIESNVYLNSGGVMGGFILNIDMQSASDNVAFAGGGFPEVKILIGDELTVDESGGILGAQVILSVGKPPQVIFPVRNSEGSRYFKTPTTRQPGPGPNGVRTQIVTAKEPLSATQGNAVTVQFEALGDLGVIRVIQGSGNALVSAYIAPQMGVSISSSGFQGVGPEDYTNCFCKIRGNVRILATNIVGAFDISPICYRSWSPSMLMFMHKPFSISSSSVLKDWVSNIQPYSDPKYSYFFNDSLTNARFSSSDKIDSSNITGILGSSSRYPDAISDPRGAITAAYSVQSLDSSAGFAADWLGPYNINGSTGFSSPAINQGPSKVASNSGLRGGSGTTNPLLKYAHTELTERELYTKPQYAGLIDKYIKYDIPCVAMWCHTYQNTQLNFAWPGVDQKDWVKIAKTKIGNRWYASNGGNSSNDPNPITTRDIERISVNYSYENAIIKKTTIVTIRNPDSSILGMLESKGVASGSKGYGKLSVNTNNRSLILDGFINNYKLEETGTGLVLSIELQDPLSYLIEKLPYPGEHIVDGWQVKDAVEYILLRLGLPVNVDNLNNISLPRLGRAVATDTGTNSIKFSAGDGALKKNLLIGMGMLPAFQYPVFYWSQEGEVRYRDAFDDSSENLDMSYTSWNDKGQPIIRDSVNMGFDTSNTKYQTVLHSKDRFRQTDIHVPVGLNQASDFNGYKSQQIINLEGFITEKYDLQLLRRQMEYQNIYTSDSSLEFKYAGAPEYNLIGGAGVVKNIRVPYAKFQKKAYILTSVSYDIEFNTGNLGTTRYQWQLLKPPIIQISGTLFGR